MNKQHRDQWAYAIGTAIYERRTALSLSQQAVASRLCDGAGDRSHLHAYESGKRMPTLPQLDLIAAGLQWDVVDLIAAAKREFAKQTLHQAAE